MIRIRLMHEGKAVKQISSRLHESVILTQIARFKNEYDTIQILEGDLSEDAKSMLQHVAKKIVPAALSAGMAMAGASAQAQGGANPNYLGLNKSIGQHISDIVSPDYNEKMRQREYERDTRRHEWNAAQNELRRSRIEASRNNVLQKNVTVYDQARPSADGKFYVIYGMDDRVTRIPVQGTEFMPADSQRLAHYIAPSGQVYYVRHSHNSEPKKENTTLFNGVSESDIAEVWANRTDTPTKKQEAEWLRRHKAHEKKNAPPKEFSDRNRKGVEDYLAAQRDKKPVEEGYTVVPGINKERYQERDGLEGPFTARNGKVVYYDKIEGKYYDPDTDFYIGNADWQSMNEGDPNAKVGTIPSGSVPTRTTVPTAKTVPATPIPGAPVGAKSKFAPTGKTTPAKFNAQGQLELDPNNPLDANAQAQLKKAGVEIAEGRSKPGNQHWATSVAQAKTAKHPDELWNTHQNVQSRYMAQLARDAGHTPTAAMIKDEKKGVAEGRYSDSEDEDFFVALGNDDDGGFVGMLTKGGGNKWRETEITGTAPHNWGSGYMGYLSPEDVMQWIRKDYRHYDVEGPFDSEEEAVDYATNNYGLNDNNNRGKHMTESSNGLESILTQFSADYAKFKEGGDIDENQDFFDALYEYFLHEMPYGTAKARTGDPYEWITQRLDQEAGVEKVAEGFLADRKRLSRTITSIEGEVKRAVGDGSRYKEVDFSVEDKIIWWTTQNTTAEEDMAAAKVIADEISTFGYDGWTVKVSTRTLMKGNATQWRGTAVSKGAEISETTHEHADKNIIMQLRKANDYDKPTTITLADDTEFRITKQTANKMLTQFNKLMPASKELMQATLNTQEGFNELLNYFGETAIANEVYLEAYARSRTIIKSVFGK